LTELEPSPGSFEFFLVERYRLFSWNAKRRRLYTGRVHHAPYRVQRATVESWSTRLFALNGLDEPKDPPKSAIAASGVDVEIFPLEAVPDQHAPANDRARPKPGPIH
jgi:uncharacterized protein YqjF (DUF2071 family)